MSDLPDVTFTENELKRIEEQFQKFCDLPVRVMKDPSSFEIDEYFEMFAAKNACFFKRENNGKEGTTFLFHYLGHGVCLNNTTHMMLNEKEQKNYNPYPIEERIRNYAKISNSSVLASLNCCRGNHYS